MSDSIIAAENLSKSYLVGHQSAERERYIALRDVIAREARNFARKGLDFIRGRQIVQGDEVEEFWALRDVSFEVRRGEVLGIIGRNGAGKSTLLKILSRITEPTRGRVTIRGRVASLLEVGTGFHPELTGRENIYLNGAILGMSQREIRKKFDDIVAFAEIDRFLDTPVKRFSSGMYVRLAFSVAAHLEPEILVVDEVLAVGDINFQQKCLGKMREVSGTEGRTVLFVSHNMNAVTSLCTHCVLLQEGQIAMAGPVDETVEAYRDTNSSGDDVRLKFLRAELPATKAFVERVELSAKGNETGSFDFKEQLYLEIRYHLLAQLNGVHCAIELCKDDEVIFKSFDTDKSPGLLGKREPGVYGALVELPRELLKPGKYFIHVTLGVPQGEIIDRVEHAVEFEILLGAENAAVISYAPHRRGVVAFNGNWRTDRLASHMKSIRLIGQSGVVISSGKDSRSSDPH
jgi:homopolymeric O-antigen transport system ATP-binding protein